MKNPPAGSNSWGQREEDAGKKSSPLVHQKEKTSKSTGKSKEASKFHQKSTDKSAQAEEQVHTVNDLEETCPLGNPIVMSTQNRSLLLRTYDCRLTQLHHLEWITLFARDDDKHVTFKDGDYNRIRLLGHRKTLLLLSCIESYQKKLNLIKPDTYRSDLKRKKSITSYSNPRGSYIRFRLGETKLMRIDETLRFCDGTLKDVRCGGGVTVGRQPEEGEKENVAYLMCFKFKEYLAYTNLHVHLKEINVDKTLRFAEEPVEIIDREAKSLKRSRIPIVKSIRT
ncbi:hypothetical protein Tco_0290625 [Tanacetum coccineum]